MNKAVIFRFIAGLMLIAQGIELGRTLTTRKYCYDAEKYGHGIITYTDIHGVDHHAVVEAYK